MKFESVKKQIEATPKIAELEAHWFKNPREKLKEAMINREPDKVTFLRASNNEKMDIHTHPGYIKPSLPSLQDLITFNTEKTRLMVIAAMTPKGEVAGYTFINKHGKQNSVKNSDIENHLLMQENERYNQMKKEVENIKKRISELKKLPETIFTKVELDRLYERWRSIGNEETKMTTERVKKNDWRIRFVPMKGFKFSHGYYIPKQPPPPPSSGGAVKIVNPPKPKIDIDPLEKERKEMEERKRLQRIRESIAQKQRNRN